MQAERPLIAQPTVRGAQRKDVSPLRECDVRVTDFVEVTMIAMNTMIACRNVCFNLPLVRDETRTTTAPFRQSTPNVLLRFSRPRCLQPTTNLHTQVMAPIMEVRVLTDVYMHLLSAGASTDWGMDSVWCNYASLRFGSNNRRHDRACMVINNDFRKVHLATFNKI